MSTFTKPGVPNMPKDNLTIAGASIDTSNAPTVGTQADSTLTSNTPTVATKDNKIIYIIVGIIALIVFIKLVK